MALEYEMTALSWTAAVKKNARHRALRQKIHNNKGAAVMFTHLDYAFSLSSRGIAQERIILKTGNLLLDVIDCYAN